jgi:hypothetical protein
MLCAASGCGNKSGLKLVPVNGTVSYNGKPLLPCSIYFRPAANLADDDSVFASAMVETDGSFRLRSFPHGTGAQAGTYKVTVSLGAGAPKALAKYTNPKSTPLLVEVPETGLDNLVIDLH